MAHKAFSSGQISDFAILSILSSHGMFSLCTNEALSLITLLPLFLVPRITKPFESTMSMCSFLDTDLTACNHQMWWTLNISLLTTIANLKKKNITLMSWKGNYFNFFSFSGCLGTLSMHYSSGLQHSSSRWVVMPTLSWQKMSSAMRRIRKPYIFFSNAKWILDILFLLLNVFFECTQVSACKNGFVRYQKIHQAEREKWPDSLKGYRSLLHFCNFLDWLVAFLGVRFQVIRIASFSLI